ncbi:MAG: Lsm family RNA-binding protein [Candidatus Heimdallarchaeota archaeon]|nr:Lsm family RNA-binding protein [Candidatus Heimdallarchaeota archaeon]
MSSNLTRQFKGELNNFDKKNIILTTTYDKVISGMLIGMGDDNSVIIADAVIGGEKHHRMFISGTVIAEIILGDAPFDMHGLRIELEKIFKKTGVRYFDDTRTIVVMDRYKVTESTVEGDGPVADRIRSIWQSYKSQTDSE